MIIKDKVIELYQAKRELTILQGTYLAVAIITLGAAGLLALINQSVGQATILVPLATIGMLAVNTVVWALLKYLIESRIERDEVIKKAIEKQAKKK